MEVGESARDLPESGLENRGVSVKVEEFGHTRSSKFSSPHLLRPGPRIHLPVNCMNCNTLIGVKDNYFKQVAFKGKWYGVFL